MRGINNSLPHPSRSPLKEERNQDEAFYCGDLWGRVLCVLARGLFKNGQ
jgi:hypothetical protein